MSELLPAGAAVQFTEIEVALLRGVDARHNAGRALTGTVVAAGPAERIAEAAEAIDELKGIGVRAVLISHGDNPAPVPRVSNHVVALNGLRLEYLNNAVAALRLAFTAITYTAPLCSRAPAFTELPSETLAAIAGSTRAGTRPWISWFVRAISAPTS